MCDYCGTNKPKYKDICSVCGNYGLEEYNFSTDDLEKTFLFKDEDKIIVINNELRMSHLLVNAGIFKSVGEADRNGWKNKPIPTGWSDLILGKRPNTKRIFIWNKSTADEMVS